MGIWKVSWKREKYGNMAEMRKESGIWVYDREEGRKWNMGI